MVSKIAVVLLPPPSKPNPNYCTFVCGPTGSDSLCRLERHRVWGLSLPLETRALPNGDEVAVRSTAVVMRLQLAEDTVAAADGSKEEEAGAASRRGAGSAIRR